MDAVNDKEIKQTKKSIMKKTGCPFGSDDQFCGEWCELFVQDYNQDGNTTGECVFKKLLNVIIDLPYDLSQWARNR